MKTPSLPRKPPAGFSIEYWELETTSGLPIIIRRAIVWVKDRGWKCFVDGDDNGILVKHWDDPLKWPSWPKYYSSYGQARKAGLRYFRGQLQYFREKVVEIQAAETLLFLKTRP